jgi:uncharacterized protein YdeI (YjbR/CyaY-like superfamily)
MTAPHFFTREELRCWLDQHHQREVEAWIGFYRKGSGRPTMTWSESVDEALCHGWIDGVRKSIDSERYVIRFTPRRAVSIWSNVNIAKVGALIEAGRMHAAGLAAWARRDESRSGIYAFERKAATLGEVQVALFRKNRRALDFF